MCMGGGSSGGGAPSYSFSSISPNPIAMANYQKAVDRAEMVSNTPFQAYSMNPDAFVANLNNLQYAGFEQVGRSAEMALPWYQQAQNTVGAGLGMYGQGAQMAGQAAGTGVYNPNVAAMSNPYYQQATGYTGQGARGTADLNVAGVSNPYYDTASGYTTGAVRDVANYDVSQLSSPAYRQATGMATYAGQETTPVGQAQIQQYMSPYMKQVTDPTMAYLRQQQEQAMAGQTGQAIRSGAFGGDRAGLAAAALAGQQQLAQGQTLGNLLQSGYGQAMQGAFQAQQARQQDLARQLQASQAVAQYGTLGRQAVEAQQAMQQQDLARQLQAGAQMGQLGTARRQAYEQQQQQQAQDYARQMQAGAQMGQIGTAQRQAYEQQQNVLQQDLARQMQAAQMYGGYGAGVGQLGQLQGQLGSAQQQAQLEGAQAFMGAGAIKQQTDQAGLQALYNQFMQWRAYPFQTSQFYTNAALGTGALMGGTQAGYSGPNMMGAAGMGGGGMFSDRRLKEGVADHAGDEPEVVGETFDGQKIYRYRLIDPETGKLGPAQIGLMADEVEGKEPQAVGETPSGLKMVDYKAATDDAARLGGAVTHPGDYADGGTVHGVYSPKMAALIAMQKGGLGGGAQAGIGSLPYAGAPSYVPESQAPNVKPLLPSHMQPVASKPRASALSQVTGGLESAKGLVGTAQALKGAYSDLSKMGSNRGGVVPHKAEGGGSFLPYSDPTPSEFPEQVLNASPKVEPLKPPALPEPKKKESSGSDAMGAIKSGLGLATSLIGMFSDRRMKTGVGMALGGDPDSVDTTPAPETNVSSKDVDLGPAIEAAHKIEDKPSAPPPEQPKPSLPEGVKPYTPTAADRDYAIRTAIAESAGQPKLGQEAVLHVIKNRLESGQFGPTIKDVVTAHKGQTYEFTPWSPRYGGGAPQRISPKSENYQQFGNLYDRVMSGEAKDPTKGALYFANPTVKYEGRPVSGWARGLGRDPSAVQIGQHYFTSRGQHFPQQFQIGAGPQMAAPAPIPPQRPGELAYLGHPAPQPEPLPAYASLGAPSAPPTGVAAVPPNLAGPAPTGIMPTQATGIGGAGLEPIGASPPVPTQLAANVPLPPVRPEGLGAAAIGKPVAPMQTAASINVRPQISAPRPHPMAPRVAQQAPLRRQPTGVKPAMAYAETEQPFYIDQLFSGFDGGFAHGGSVRHAYEDGGGDADGWNRIIRQESGGKQFDKYGNPLTSSAGAIGVAQVMPGTAPEAAKLAGVEFDPVRYRTDKDYNEMLGKAYYNQQLKDFGSHELAAAAYNAGPARLQKALAQAEKTGGSYLNFLPSETQDYVARVAGGDDGVHMRNLPPNARSFMASAERAPSGVVPGEKPQGISGFFRGTAPADTGEKALDFLTSERFIVPALAGLAAAANYPDRRYTGSAILSGLGAAGQAYMQVPKTEAETSEIEERAKRTAEEAKKLTAETGEVGAREAQIRSGIPNNALVVDPNTGTILGIKVYVGNQLKVISPKEYFDAQRRGESYQLAPTGGYGGAEKSEPAPPVDIGLPSGSEGSKPKEAPKGSPKAPAIGAAAPIGGELGKSDMDFARDAAKDVQQSGFKYLEKSPEANPFEGQSQAAAVAAGNLQQRNALAKALGGLQEKGPVTAGKFSAEVATPMVQWVNSALDAMNAPADFRISSADQLSNAEVAKKLSTLLATRQTTAAGQHANAALSTLLNATPSQLNTPKGAAALVSDLFINDQRDMDLDRYYRNMRKYAEQTSGINQAQSQFIGRGMRDRYFGEREKIYSHEKKALQDMYLQPFRYKDENGQMRDTHLMNFIIERGGVVPEKLSKEIEKRYGPGILRYFTGQQ